MGKQVILCCQEKHRREVLAARTPNRHRWQLDKDAVDVRVVVQFHDHLEHTLGGGVRREVDPDRSDPHPFARPVLHPDVHL